MYNAEEGSFARQSQDPDSDKVSGPGAVLRHLAKLQYCLLGYADNVANAATMHRAAAEVTALVGGSSRNSDEHGHESGCYRAVLESLLAGFPSGARMTPEYIEATARRMAGNVARLRAGVSVTPWQFQSMAEMCLARIVDVADATLNIQIYTGLPAGLAVAVRTRVKNYDRLVVRLGVATHRTLATTHVFQAELSGMWLGVKLAKAETFAITGVVCPAGLKARNRQLHAARQMPARTCPRHFTWECYACPLTRHKCGLSVFSTLQAKDCANGHRGMLRHGATLCVVCEANDWRCRRGILPLYQPPKIVKKETAT